MKPLTLEETRLKEEMKNNCLKVGKYKDEKAKDKFKMLCHLEDFMIQYWELLKESKQLKQKYVNAVADYEKTMFEKEQLKKQLEENKDKINWYENFEINKTIDKLRIKHNNQQKEFIDYLENEIYSIEPKGTGVNYNCEYDSEEDYIKGMKEQSKLNTFKEILSKFKKIIGNDINVGSKGGKE